MKVETVTDDTQDKNRGTSTSERGRPDIRPTENRIKPSFSYYQDKSPLITNCAIPLFYINPNPTGYFSLLSGKHLSTWNYYCARAPGETHTAVNLVELW